MVCVKRRRRWLLMRGREEMMFCGCSIIGSIGSAIDAPAAAVLFPVASAVVLIEERLVCPEPLGTLGVLIFRYLGAIKLLASSLYDFCEMSRSDDKEYFWPRPWGVSPLSQWVASYVSHLKPNRHFEAISNSKRQPYNFSSARVFSPKKSRIEIA